MYFEARRPLRVVRLLLDEHFSPMIARALRRRGHDVAAVKERLDPIARPDEAIFAAAVAEGRAVVTMDVEDYRAMAVEALRRGVPSRGLVIVSVRRFHRPEKSGAVMRALDRLLRELSGEDDLVRLRGGEHWLQPLP